MSNVTDDQLGALIRSYGWNGDNVKYTPLNLNYRFSTTIRNIILVLFFLVFDLLLSQKSLAAIPPSPVFVLKESFRSRLSYSIQIFSDGKVHYQGFSTAVIGDRYAQLKPAQLDELVLYFLSLPFEEAKKYEMKRGFEAWTDTIDYKNIYLSISMNDPVFFSVVAKKLDRLINIRRWVCFPKGHPKFNTVCLRYDMPDDIESILNFK